MFSYLTLAQRIPMDHPARQIRALVDRALERMDAELEKLYSDTGRPSIAPERLLRATLLMILYSIRSERQLMEQMNYNLLFRWFPPQRRRPVAGVPSFQLQRETLWPQCNKPTPSQSGPIISRLQSPKAKFSTRARNSGEQSNRAYRRQRLSFAPSLT